MMLRQLVRAWRRQHKVSQEALGHQLGLSGVTIHRFELGGNLRGPQLLRVLRWALSEPVAGRGGS